MAAGRMTWTGLGLAGIVGILLAAAGATGGEAGDQAAALKAALAAVPDRIVYETFRDGNWELFTVQADGSDPGNLTRTPKVNELYPHVSPNGTKVCFVADEGEGDAMVRNVYWMNLDGTGRTLVARNAREPCWRGDGKAIAYLKGEFEKFCYLDYATKGLAVYDLASGAHAEHPNKDLFHLYNLCWTPDGKWFLATVHGGMGFDHAILAIEAAGPKVVNLHIPGCRPDVSPDGRRVAWGAEDYALRIGDLDFSGPEPKVVRSRDVVTSTKPMKIYHVDWSPDGRYVAFSRGPAEERLGLAPEIVGVKATGWNICVADASAKNRWTAITDDGLCDKEPDWAPAPKPKP